MMKVVSSLFFILFLNVLGFSQTEITWDFSYNQKSSQVEMKATLAPGWHLYSTDLGNVLGLVPTLFEFWKNSKVKLYNDVIEPTPKEKFDPNFEENVKYFEKEVVFAQEVEFKKNTTLKGTVVYMVCNETMCLPPVEYLFEISLTK